MGWKGVFGASGNVQAGSVTTDGQSTLTVANELSVSAEVTVNWASMIHVGGDIQIGELSLDDVDATLEVCGRAK